MKILVTGCTGSLGHALLPLLLKDGHEVISYSRDEQKARLLPHDDKLTVYLGDVRDKDRVMEASRGVDLVFHLASLKCIDTLEFNPEEAFKTIVVGTDNVLHAQRVHGIKRVVFISTDKAVYPVNAYGMAKGLAEKIVMRNPNNIVCRYGNCLASRGSVLETLVKSLKEEKVVKLTDPNMSRFWITLEEAAHFVFCQAQEKKGGLKIPPMKAAPVHLLAQTVANIMNINSYQVKQIGTRPGEKMAECIRSFIEGEELYSNIAPQFTEEELYRMIKPTVASML